MCSIFGILDIKSDPVALRKSALEMSKRLRHRGPDWSGVYSTDKAILVHERLSIVDPGNGAQPLYNPERTHVLAVNGEIYNHKELEKELTVDFQFQTGSDCEIILAKYKEGDGYVTYEKLTEDDRKVLSTAVNTLAEDLSTLRGKLGLD